MKALARLEKSPLSYSNLRGLEKHKFIKEKSISLVSTKLRQKISKFI